MAPIRMASSILVVGWLWSSLPANAQPIGTYRWQLLPYCNVLTLNVSQQGGIYTLDGTDDRCGAGQAASARGLAFLNPMGTIGFGVTMVQPGGVPTHLEATITLPTLNGTWRDSSGASGNYVQVSGAGFGGPPRLVAPSGVPPGSITAIQLANGAVGPTAIAGNAITGSHVVDGSLSSADIGDAPRAVSAEVVDPPIHLSLLNVSVVQVTVAAPAAGHVIVNVSGSFKFADSAVPESATCSITNKLGFEYPVSAHASERNISGLSPLEFVPFGGTRMFKVAAGSSTTFRLICYSYSAQAFVYWPVMTALYVASS